MGERTSFSAYGLVTNLNGVPIKTGNVFARSEDFVEQAEIATDGTFRLKGLQPTYTYTLTVESDQI